MMLSDGSIRDVLDSGDLVIDGLVNGAIQPASVDFHLSDRPFKVIPSYGVTIPWEDQSRQMVEVEFRPIPSGLYKGRDIIHLQPGEFALASTSERVTIPDDLAGRLEGKSSLARLGLLIHTTAGFFDPGFTGWPTLELLNVGPRPIALTPGMPIAQMCFFEMDRPVDVPYGSSGSSSKYGEQAAEPTASRYHMNTIEPVLVSTNTCECCDGAG